MKRQHKTPCKSCPFKRASLAGYLGGTDAHDFQQMAQSDARMPCHTTIPKNNRGANTVDYEAAQIPGTIYHNAPQCAGRAIHWANQVKTQKIPGTLLELPRDTLTVFEWPKQFIDHHGRQ